MAFTALDVKALREKTGVGMMECKKALVEADGDMDKAIDYLRERGLAAATKKAGRTAAEGVVLAYTDDAKKVGVLVEVNSETDFVGKNEKFQAFVLDVAKTIVDKNPGDVEDLLDVNLFESERTVQENLQDIILSIGENMKIRRFERVEGTTFTYIHAGGSVGVIVSADVAEDIAEKEELAEMGKNIAMQIVAMKPQYLDIADISEEAVEHEYEIQIAQMKNDPDMSSKPDAVIKKIAEGKMSKFYKEVCLMEQEFVRSDLFKGSVKGYIADVAKRLGGDIKITDFTCYIKGEGIEKKEENFADEIASMIN
ncbi:MAG: elongation factor Ts [Ruminococcaceae bacterium]|nr:elongation factor Ts [Oscillospiraceae bacterium]